MKIQATIVVFLVFASFTLPLFADAPPLPKLTVFVIVDQLRGDMLPRIHERLGEGGFRRFLDNGVFYANAEYRHSTTFTAVGHASLVTGGNAPEHGIVGNQWYDQESGKRVYCVEDSEHHYLDAETPPEAGTSPRNLISSTICDELVMETGFKGKAFTVALKDRSAILCGGRLAKTFWFDKGSGKFISSTFYYDALPNWVKAWNETEPSKAFRGATWDLMQPRENYIFGNQDDRADEMDYKALGKTFPHALSQVPPEFLNTALYFTPFGDRMTLGFARRLIEEEGLGKDEYPDLLVCGMSTQDYIGHTYGPNSLEAEDNLLQLDAALSSFFAYAEEKIGHDQILFVLSSDHGIHEIPEYMSALGYPGGRIVPQEMLAFAEKALQEKYATTESFLSGFENPCLYLNLDTLRILGLDLGEVEGALAVAMRSYPGIAIAVAASDIAENRLPNSPYMEKISRSFYPARSGNVFIVEKPFWYLYSDASKYAAMHGSPYAYDTHVPVAFSGMGIKPQWVWNSVAPESLAPTLAAFMRVKRPSASTAPLLVEVLNR